MITIVEHHVKRRTVSMKCPTYIIYFLYMYQCSFAPHEGIKFIHHPFFFVLVAVLLFRTALPPPLKRTILAQR